MTTKRKDKITVRGKTRRVAAATASPQPAVGPDKGDQAQGGTKARPPAGKPAVAPVKQRKPFHGHRWTPKEFAKVIDLMHAQRDEGAAYGAAAQVVGRLMNMTPGQVACGYDIGLRKQAWAAKA